MRAALFLSTALLLGACTAAAPAYAQSARMTCHDAAEITKQLSQQYDEAPVAFGFQPNGNLLQVYASSRNDTWTIVTTTPAGVSCIVAVGTRWEMLPTIPSGPIA